MAGPWKDSYPILEPSSWDDEIARRRYGALRAEFHNLSAFRYNNAPLSSKGASDTGIHLGLLGVLYATAEQAPGEKNQMPCDGPIDAQFVSTGGTLTAHGRRRSPAATATPSTEV